MTSSISHSYEQAANAQLTEQSASVRRVVALVVALAISGAWMALGGDPENTLPAEARRVFPVIVLLLLIASSWAYVVRSGYAARWPWADAVGATSNLVGTGLILHFGWNAMLPFVVALPLSCIGIGARFSPRWFWLSLFASVVVLGISAPWGYWGSRPMVGLLAVFLVVGIPISVVRVILSHQSAVRAASDARSSQARFLAMMSHELRTPLFSIIHTADNIELSKLSERDAALVKTAAASGRVLLRRINEVLDVAAGALGKLQLRLVPFRWSEVTNAVASVIEPLAAERGIRWEMNDAAMGLALVGDAGRIEQILVNLCANGVKYTPPGGEVILNVSYHVAANGVVLQCDVLDSGPGIAQDKKEKLFEAFERGVVPGSVDGAGLGLHIVDRLSALMDGRIAVHDREGGGTLFRWSVTLPGADPKVIAPAADIQSVFSQHRATVRPMKCLIADDQPGNRRILEVILNRAGHTTVLAGDGASALAILENEPFDLALMDIEMPQMDGWQVLDALQRKPSPRPVVIMLSAYSDSVAVEKAREHGAAEYLMKPVEAPALLRAIAQAGSPP